jgi:hypothetical protein
VVGLNSQPAAIAAHHMVTDCLIILAASKKLTADPLKC